LAKFASSVYLEVDSLNLRRLSFSKRTYMPFTLSV